MLLGVSYWASSFATDSTSAVAPTITTPAMTSITGCSGASVNCPLAGSGTSINGTANPSTSPYYTSLSASSNTITVPVNGIYLVVANFIFTQVDNPAYFWLDVWADNTDIRGNAVKTRIIYSGDTPSLINVGTGNSTNAMTYSGVVHLSANSTIYTPRIWSTCTETNYCGNFQYSTCNNGTGGCISVYLLSYP